MQTLNLEGKVRTQTGRNAAKSSRQTGMIPCVLYGEDVNIKFDASEHAVRHLVYTPHYYKVNVKIDGSEYEALMREIQFHPVTDKIQHIDFYKINPAKKVTISVPVIIKGVAEGMKQGGKLYQRMRKIRIQAFPKDLIDKIEIDVTALELGKSIRLGEIEIKGVELLGTKSAPVVNCLIPRVIVEEVKPAEATAVAATTETADATKEKEGDKEKEKGKEKSKEKGKEK